MAVAVDASSPIRWTGAPALGGTITSASFTAPVDSILVVCVETDGISGTNAITVSDSSGLTWAKQVERLWDETTAGGHSAIWTAIAAASVARTITLTKGVAGDTGVRLSAKCYVVTGADISGTPVDAVGASNEGGSTTNSISTSSVTPGANGFLFVADCDWSASGTFEASSNLTSTDGGADYSGAISVYDGYRTVTSGVGVTANLNGAGTGAVQHKWTQIIVREAGGAAETVTLDKWWTQAPPNKPQRAVPIASGIIGIRNT